MRVVPRSVVALVAGAGMLAGCGSGVGDQCDMNQAKQLVYLGGVPYYAGQGLVQVACANGQCHAEGAVGAARTGAPHGLNFDLAPLGNAAMPAAVNALRSGVAKVRDEADDMYDQLLSGAMPPGELGKRNPAGFTRADGSPLTPAFPTIESDQGKATVKNWLACNAPVVAGYTNGATAAAPEAAAIGDVVPFGKVVIPATFADVYTQVLSTCSSCHKAGSVFPELDLSTQAAAYAALVNKPAATMGSGGPKCGGRGVLVTPGNCETSLLYLKLLPAPPCGDQMPLGAPLAKAAGADPVCAWIMAGAKP